MAVFIVSASLSANSLEPCQDSQTIRADLNTGRACVVIVRQSQDGSKVQGLAVETATRSYCVENIIVDSQQSAVELDKLLDKSMCEKEEQ
jgi:hypothetical protein